MNGPDARVSPPDRSQTVGQTLKAAALPLDRFVASDGYPGMRVRDDHEAALLACAALGLDPTEPLDGPLVVLHPGQHVVERRPPRPGDSYILTAYDHPVSHEPGARLPQWVVVASNPQERTP